MVNNEFIKGPRGIIHMTAFMVFGAAAISIAFVTDNWALVKLSNTAYYCIAVDCVGAIYAIGMVVFIGFQIGQIQELQFKLVNIALSTIFAMLAISAGIIYALNAHDAFLLNKYGVYILRGSTLAAASALNFLASICMCANAGFWSRV